MATIVGTGSQAIYVYYFQQYAANIDDDEQYYWPCKIGMSTKNVYDRIVNQVKTAMPEMPVIGLIVKTDNAAGLEKALHAILQFKQRQIITAGGSEWYNTTPDEVLLLCQAINAY